MLIGAAPFGLIFGVNALAAGLSPMATMAFSLFVFAGSSQFVAASLVAQGAMLPVIWLTALVVNIRHMLYGTVLGPFAAKYAWRWLMPLAFWLTDETFAVVSGRIGQQSATDNRALRAYWLGSSVVMYLNWQCWTLAGLWIGQEMTGLEDWGLEFAMAATFIAIVSAQLASPGLWVSAIVASVAALVFAEWPYQSGLLGAVAVAIFMGWSVDAALARFRSSTVNAP